MRKLKLQVQISIDGFICGPNGEMDWLVMNWGADIKAYVDMITEPVDTILLGRNLAQGFIPHWAGVASDESNPEQSAGRKYSLTPKIVFSKTLKSSPWENAVIANGDLVEEVTAVKKRRGGDVIAYGGSTFVSSLLKANLIDELHLFVNPTVLGRGMPIFNEVRQNQKYKLDTVKTFECGIVMLHYNRV